MTYLTLKNVFPRLTLKIDFILIQVVEVNREVFTQIEGYAGAANGRSNNYYQYVLILNRIYTSRHLIFFALFYLFETDDLRSYRGCFLTICQICYFYLGGVNSTLLIIWLLIQYCSTVDFCSFVCRFLSSVVILS